MEYIVLRKRRSNAENSIRSFIRSFFGVQQFRFFEIFSLFLTFLTIWLLLAVVVVMVVLDPFQVGRCIVLHCAGMK